MIEQKREGNGNAEEKEKGKEGGRVVEDVKQGMGCM